MPSPPAVAAAAASDSMGKIVETSVFNKSGVRLAVLIAAIGASFAGARVLPGATVIVAHVAAAGIWLGVNVWTTFFAGITMFKSLPRQQFGKLQAKLFPLYFTLISACCALLLGTVQVGPFVHVAPPRVVHTLALGLVTALSNLFFIEPKATKILMQRYELENSGQVDSPNRKSLTKSFGMLHGLSSLANLGNLAAAMAHTAWIAMMLQGAF